MKCKIIYIVFLILIMITPANAKIIFHDMKMTSYPNPSVEGQEVTFNVTINLTDTETGEIYPANEGAGGFLNLLGGPTYVITNGTMSKSVYLGPGEYYFEAVYIGGEPIGSDELLHDNYAELSHEVLPYIQDCHVSSSPNPSVEGQPVTYTVTFDLAEVDDPNNLPLVGFLFYDGISQYYLTDSFYEDRILTWTVYDQAGAYTYYLTDGFYEDRIVTWTVVYDQAGAYNVLVRPEVINDGINPSLPEYYTFIQQVNSESVGIPEFPSVVLPVVVILGLIALFGRKKE